MNVPLPLKHWYKLALPQDIWQLSRRVIYQDKEWLEDRSRLRTQRIQLASRFGNKCAALGGRLFQG